MFHLPRVDGTLSERTAREAMGDMATVVEILNPANVAKLPATWQAMKSAERFLAETPAASRVNTIVLRADTDERWLISIGKRGGWKKLWNFGTGR